MPGNLKVRKLLQTVRELGCHPIRTKGSHQTWRTPAGAHLTIVVNHANADVAPGVLVGVRRVLQREGLRFEPLPPSQPRTRRAAGHCDANRGPEAA